VRLRFWLFGPAFPAWVAASGCGPAVPLADRVERDLLLRQKAALERELSRAADDSDHATAALVVVPASLLGRLLAVALPVRAEVDRFEITADSASVDFGGGLALVRLAARVGWLDRDDVTAAITVIGALEVLDVEESAGTLTSRIEILGWETHELRLGALSPPAERLLDELAERPASDLNALLSSIQIPVRLVEAIRLPAVEEDEVSIAAVAIPLEGRLHDVRVGADRLWIYIDIGARGVER